MPEETIRTTCALLSETLQERMDPLMALTAMQGLSPAEQQAWQAYGDDLRAQRQADDAHRGF